MNKVSVVSVLMVTYNHERFIAEAIESVMMQKTDFNYQLIIGEDLSTDGTLTICEAYANKFSDKIKLLKRSKNVGMMQNFFEVFAECTGKYIAILDGDDYWTDPYKLQKQVDFLEKNNQYIGCFHNSEERYEGDDNMASYLYCNYRTARSVGFNDLSFANLIPTCSVVFRSKLFEQLPEWLLNLNMADWPIHLLNTQFGDYWYIPKVMGVHRLHKKSTWMLQDAEINNSLVVKAYDIMIEGFGKNPELQQKLLLGKLAFTTPPKKITFKNRGINFIKRLLK